MYLNLFGIVPKIVEFATDVLQHNVKGFCLRGQS